MNIIVAKYRGAFEIYHAGSLCNIANTEIGAETALESLGVSNEECSIALGLLDSTFDEVHFDAEGRVIISKEYGQIED